MKVLQETITITKMATKKVIIQMVVQTITKIVQTTIVIKITTVMVIVLTNLSAMKNKIEFVLQ